MQTTFTNTTNGRKIFFVLMIQLLVLCAVQFSFLQNLHGAGAPNSTKTEVQENATDKADVPEEDEFFYPFGLHNWDPYEEIQSMREQMGRIFNNFDNRLQMSPFFRKDRQPFSIEPQADIEETDDQFIITMNIPGADNGEINVNLEDNVLTVSATTRRSNEETKDRNYIRMERSTGSIHRAMTLPAPVEIDSMRTTYKYGILTITVSKKKTDTPQ